MFARIAQLPVVRLLGAILGLALIVLLFAWFQRLNFNPGYGEDDPDGYLFLARQILAQHPLHPLTLHPPTIRDNDPFRYQKHFWVETYAGDLTTKYPLGFPLLLAGAQWIGGDQAMFLVSPVMGGLTIVGIYLITRLWLSRRYALVAALVLVLNSMFEFFAGYLLSHAAELCFTTWGTLFVLWFLRTSDPPPPDTTSFTVKHPLDLPPDFVANNVEVEPPAHRQSRRWGVAALCAILAGFTLGFACAIRYTSLAMAPPVAWAAWVFLYRYRKASIFARLPGYLLLFSFSVIPLLCAGYNHLVFGAFYRTGYALTDEQNSYTLEHFVRGSHVLLSGINAEVAFALFPLAIVAIGGVVSKTHRILFLLMFLPLYLVYASYYWTPNGSHYFRFMLYSLSILIPMGIVLIGRLQGPARVRRWAVVALLVLIGADAWARIIEPGIEGHLFWNMHGGAMMNSALASTLAPDTVVFSGYDGVVHEGVLMNLKVYQLSTFEPGERLPPNPDPYRADPLIQPIRFAWTKTFYHVNHGPALQARKVEMIRSYLLEQHRPVVMILEKNKVVAEQKQLGPDIKLRLIRESDTMSWGRTITLGIYEVLPVEESPTTMPVEAK